MVGCLREEGGELDYPSAVRTMAQLVWLNHGKESVAPDHWRMFRSRRPRMRLGRIDCGTAHGGDASEALCCSRSRGTAGPTGEHNRPLWVTTPDVGGGTGVCAYELLPNGPGGGATG